MIRPDELPETYHAEPEQVDRIGALIAALVVSLFLAMAAAFLTGWLARGWLL